MGTKESILQAAYKQVAEVGFDGVTIDKVCKDAGVTKPTVYHHFGSKEGLLSAVVDAVFSAFIDPEDSIYETSDVSKYRDELLIYGNQIIDRFRGDIEQQKVIANASCYREQIPSIAQQELKRMEKWTETLHCIFDHGVEIGAFGDDFDIDQTVQHVKVLFDGISDEVLFPMGINVRDVWRHELELIFGNRN